MSNKSEQKPIHEFKVWVRHEDGELVCHYFYEASAQKAVNSLRDAHPEWEIIFASPTGKKIC